MHSNRLFRERPLQAASVLQMDPYVSEALNVRLV
uniref:Uncharacterized protein n=1 Tax=Anguilla anguilla TaxID=7936 RepID=A0A0E9U5P7_ANGAN